MAYRAFLTNLYGLSLTPEAGGLVYTYVRNTSTPLAVATDALGATPATNPVVADSLGQTTFYYSDAVQYTWRATTANGATTLWQADVVGGAVSYTFINDGLIRQFEQTATGTGASQVVTISNVVLTSPYQLLVSIDGIFQPTSAYEVGNNGTNTSVTITAPSGSSIVLRSNAAQGITGPSGTPADMDGYTTLSGGDGTETHWVRTSGSLNRKVTTNNTPVKATGSTTARTLANRFAERINVMDYGAVADGTSNPLSDRYATLAAAQVDYSFATSLTQELDWAALQKAWNVGVATGKNFTVMLPDGDYYVTDEIICTGITSGSQRGGGFAAETRWRARILATAFGRTKKLFKFGDNTSSASRPSVYAFMSGLVIQSHNSAANVDHPIAIWHPYASAFWFEHLRVHRWGNTAYWVSDVNNGVFFDCWAFRVGTGYVRFDSTKNNFAGTVTTTATDATVTATGTPFIDPDHVSKRVYLSNSGYNSGSSAAPLVATISSVTNSGEIELDVAAVSSKSSGYMSFENIRGAITAADTTLVVDTAIFSASDVGRYIYIDRAGTNNGVLCTTIASYTSATEVELADAAAVSVSAEFVWFTHGFWIGTTETDRVSGSSPVTNDVKMIDCQVERYFGVAIHQAYGVNSWISDQKIHGLGDDEAGFGACLYQIVADQMRSLHVQNVEMDFGFCGGSDGGNIAMRGGFCHLSLTHVAAGQIPTYQHFVDFDCDTNSVLTLGDIQIDRSLTDLELVKFSGTAGKRQVNQIGAITTRASANNWPYQQPTRAAGIAHGRNVSMADDTAISFTPPHTHGHLIVSSSASTVHGVYNFRTTSSPYIADAATDGSDMDITGTGALTGTTSTDTKFNIRAVNDGKIYLENRTGAAIFVSWGVIG